MNLKSKAIYDNTLIYIEHDLKGFKEGRKAKQINMLKHDTNCGFSATKKFVSLSNWRENQSKHFYHTQEELTKKESNNKIILHLSKYTIDPPEFSTSRYGASSSAATTPPLDAMYWPICIQINMVHDNLMLIFPKSNAETGTPFT